MHMSTSLPLKTAHVSVFAALILACLLALSTSVNAVVDGRPDGSQHPNVGLIIGLDSEGTGIYTCTGTLVDPTTVLSAAHCLGGQDFAEPISEIVVVFDDHLRQRPDGSYQIDTFLEGVADPNPLYEDVPTSQGSGGRKAFLAHAATDIGLLHLDTRADSVFPGVQPAPITGAGTNDRYRNGTTKELVLQVGYGVQRVGAPGQPSSYFIDYTRNQSLIQPKKLTDSLLFLGTNPNNASGYGSPCGGDSGSPVFRDGTVISLFTFADGVCQNIGGGARLDAGPGRDFLRSRGLVP